MAGTDDAPAMLSIYGQYIDTSITFETALPSEDDFRGRVESTLSESPWLVMEDDGRIVAYAYAHRLMGRGAYRWSSELSVYVDMEHRGRGIGKALYDTLLTILRKQNVVNAFACVTVPNPPSEGFHRSMGFREVGRFEKSGFKAGEWHDVAWFEMELNPHSDDPADIVFLPELGKGLVDSILRDAQSH